MISIIYLGIGMDSSEMDIFLFPELENSPRIICELAISFPKQFYVDLWKRIKEEKQIITVSIENKKKELRIM